MTFRDLFGLMISDFTGEQLDSDITVRTNDGECYPVTNFVFADDSQDQLDIGHPVLEIPIDLS